MKRALRRRYGHTASGGVRAALVGYSPTPSWQWEWKLDRSWIEASTR